MSNETFKTDLGNVPKLTKGNYPVWEEKIHRVRITKNPYNIVTGVELLPVGNGVALYLQQDSWHDGANKALAQIYLRHCDELLPLIYNINNSVEMWEALRDRFDNASTKLGRTQVLPKFTASPPSQDEIVTLYFPKLIAFRKKLISTTENITDDTIKTRIFTTLSNSYETTIQILEQRIPAPMAQECMDAIREYAKWTTLTQDIRYASTSAVPYSRAGNLGRGSGFGRRRQVAYVEVDEEKDARRTNAHAAKWTIIPPKHAERESTLNTTQTPAVQTPALQTQALQTPPGTTNVLGTTAVSQDTSSPTAFTSNVPGINTTKSTRALHP